MTDTSLEEKNQNLQNNFYTLSIRLMPNGFSFSRYDLRKDDSFSYQKTVFPQGTSYIHALEDAVLNNELMLQPYKEVNIIVVSEHFTLIPKILDSSSARESFYNLNIESDKEVILDNELRQTGMVNVFGIEREIYGFICRTFLSPRFYHHLSVLSEYFYQKSRIGNNAKMICQTRNNIIDILCFEKGRLILANTFRYYNIKDAAYLILNGWQQVAFDARKDTLQITGDNALTKQIQQVIRPYLANIEPIVFPTQFLKYGEATINAPFDMIALPLCDI